MWTLVHKQLIHNALLIILGAFIDDCALFLNINPGKNAEEITGLIDKAVDLYE